MAYFILMLLQFIEIDSEKKIVSYLQTRALAYSRHLPNPINQNQTNPAKCINATIQA
jgi:hypothetical protein